MQRLESGRHLRGRFLQPPAHARLLIEKLALLPFECLEPLLGRLAARLQSGQLALQSLRLVLRAADLGAQRLERLLGRLAPPGALAQPRLQRVQFRRPPRQFRRDLRDLLVRASEFLPLHLLPLAGPGDLGLAARQRLPQLPAGLLVVRDPALRLHHAVAQRLHGLPRRLDLLLEFFQTGAVPGHRTLALLQSRRRLLPARLQLLQPLRDPVLLIAQRIVLTPREVELEHAEIARQRLVAPRLARLPLQRADLPLDLAHDVVHANEIRLGVFEFPQRLALLRLELGDARRLLENRAPVLRTTAQDQVDLALLHDRVTAPPDARVHEQLMDVAQAARRLVEQILALAVAENAPRHTDFLPLGAKMPRASAEGQRHLRHPHRSPRVRAAENDVRHLAAAQRLGRLLAQAPADRVEDVRLAATIRADHRSDALVKFQVRLVDERFKTDEIERFEIHGAENPDWHF